MQTVTVTVKVCSISLRLLLFSHIIKRDGCSNKYTDFKLAARKKFSAVNSVGD